MPKMLARSVNVYDEASGEYTMYEAGHVFADGDPVLELVGDHCFTDPQKPEGEADGSTVGKPYSEMNVRELRELIEARNNAGEQIDPDSSRREDLVKALEFADELKTAG